MRISFEYKLYDHYRDILAEVDNILEEVRILRKKSILRITKKSFLLLLMLCLLLGSFWCSVNLVQNTNINIFLPFGLFGGVLAALHFISKELIKDFRVGLFSLSYLKGVREEINECRECDIEYIKQLQESGAETIEEDDLNINQDRVNSLRFRNYILANPEQFPDLAARNKNVSERFEKKLEFYREKSLRENK